MFSITTHDIQVIDKEKSVNFECSETIKEARKIFMSCIKEPESFYFLLSAIEKIDAKRKEMLNLGPNRASQLKDIDAIRYAIALIFLDS